MAALPALDESLTFPAHTGYMVENTDPTKFRNNEFHAVINLSAYSPSYSDLRVLSLGRKLTPNPPHVDSLSL